MQLLQSIMLWGLLGISIPILIHLWNGRRGKLISWAAMRWLDEQASARAKGFELKNLLVLALRCLLIGLLVLILAEMVIDKWIMEEEGQVVHLVQPDTNVVEEFRFEISQALERGEVVVLADGSEKEISSLEELVVFASESDFELQKTLDQLDENIAELSIYLSKSQQLPASGFYSAPISPALFISTIDDQKPDSKFIQLNESKFLKLNESGLLELDSLSENSGTEIIDLQEISWFVDEELEGQKNYWEAAFQAINEVYAVQFVEVENAEDADLVISNAEPRERDADQIYVQLDEFSFASKPRQINISEGLEDQQSELLSSGRFAEFVFGKLLEMNDFTPKSTGISSSQLKNRFVLKDPQDNKEQPNAQHLLFGLFLLVFALERYFSHKQKI